MTLKQVWLESLIRQIPQTTADYDYLVERALPRLRTREIQALSDAFMLARLEHKA